ncbi:glycosyltransferase family 4 protein [Rurimicrobium arvi]|uniref:Uncharacterized protein n=1 Tax=Rurimicrobium arvi TaxID=2049916 RepID=A0ABP8MCX7_9BACT
MNILFICDEYPPGLTGGIGIITQSLAKEMVRQGHTVHVAGLYAHDYGGASYYEDEGVHVWKVFYGWRMPAIPLLYSAQRKLPGALKRILFAKSDFKRYTRFIEELINKYKIDIVEHPDWVSYAYHMGLKNPVLPGLSIPVLLKFHGSQSYMSDVLHTKLRWQDARTDRQLIERADALSAVSAFAAGINKKLFDLQQTISVLYNGIRLPERPTLPRDKRTVLFAGSLVPNKGVFQLVKAWPLVLREVPDAKLIILGKGNQEPLKQMLSDETLRSVVFRGHQPREVLLQHMRTATLSLLPSFTETFGLVAIESMSNYCPTIFTKRTCGPEIIRDGAEGLLVDPDNIEEIARKTILLLTDEQLRDELAIKGRAKVEQLFDISKCAADHIQLYTRVTGNYKNEQR